MPTPLTACPEPHRLDDLLANRLPSAEAQALRDHLRDCTACQQRLAPPTSGTDAATHPSRTGTWAGTGSRPTLSPPLVPGDLGSLARYRVLGVLGEGGMGVVYDAEDPALCRRVALKVLRPDVADASMRDRFQREAQALAGMPHEHIVTLLEAGEANGTLYLTMERLQGESLAQRLHRDGSLPMVEALRIAREAAEGLSDAHDRGMIHRDVKPGNLFLESRDLRPLRVKLLDFGIARNQAQPDGLTTVGRIIGTPLYMAPEQAAGLPLDGRADLYSLGCVLFHMVTGQPPHTDPGTDTLAVLGAVIRGDPVTVPAALAKLSPDVAALLEQLLSPAPANRPAAARLVVARIQQIEADGAGARHPGPGPSTAQRDRLRRKPAVVGIALGTLLILAALVVGAVSAYSRFFAPGGGDPDDAAAPAASAGVPAAAGDPIKVGILHSLSGSLAVHERPIVQAVMMAIEEVNQAGGVLGRPVEAVQRDGASDETVFARKAERLLSEDRVQALFGCWTSSSRKRVAEVCRRHDRLLFFSVGHEGLESSPHVVHLGGTPNQTVLPLARWAYAEKRRRRFFLLGSDHVYSHVIAVLLRHEIEALGATVVGEEYVPLGEDGFADTVARVKKAAPDILINTIDGQENLFLFQSLRAAGIDPRTVPTVWVSLSETNLSQFRTERLIGDYTVGCYFDTVKGEANRSFLERFRKRHGSGERVDDAMETSYAAVFAWKRAVELAGTTDTGPLRRRLRGLHVNAPEGPIELTDDLHAFRTGRIGQVEHRGLLPGFRIVYTSPEPLPPEPFPAWKSKDQWDALLAGLFAGWGNKWERHR